MESNAFITGLRVSGNMLADCTLLVTDMFDLFPSSFQRLIPLLEKRYQIVNYTDNGFDIFNRTKQLRHSTITGYANDLIVSLQEKRIQNVTYLAYSVNALVAFHAARLAPELFDKIILLCALPSLKQDPKTQYRCGFDSDIANDILFGNILQANDLAANSPVQLISLLKISFANMPVEKARTIFNLIISTDCRSFLGKITVPVMILQGFGDKIVTNEAAFFMHRHIPESYIVKIKAKGHLPQMQSPEEVSAAIEIFMQPVIS